MVRKILALLCIQRFQMNRWNFFLYLFFWPKFFWGFGPFHKHCNRGCFFGREVLHHSWATSDLASCIVDVMEWIKYIVWLVFFSYPKCQNAPNYSGYNRCSQARFTKYLWMLYIWEFGFLTCKKKATWKDCFFEILKKKKKRKQKNEEYSNDRGQLLRPVGNFQQLKINPEMLKNKHPSKFKAYNTSKNSVRNAYKQTQSEMLINKHRCKCKAYNVNVLHQKACMYIAYMHGTWNFLFVSEKQIDELTE